jgi:hypothetical protein
VISERVKAVSGWKLFQFKQSLNHYGKPEVFRARVKAVLLAKHKTAQDEEIATAVAKAKAEASMIGRLFG